MKIGNIIQLLLLLLPVMVLAGCTQHIDLGYFYDLGPIKPEEKAVLSNIVLDIQTLDDIRHDVPENAILFTDTSHIEKDGSRYCINSDKFYEKNSVAYEITKFMVKLMKKRDSFRMITLNNEKETDYYVTGKIRRFYAEQEMSLLSGFPVLGGMTKESDFIEFTGFTIFDKTGQIVTKLPDVSEQWHSKGAAGPCDVYRLARYRLKFVVDKLAINIEDAVFNEIQKNNAKTDHDPAQTPAKTN